MSTRAVSTSVSSGFSCTKFGILVSLGIGFAIGVLCSLAVMYARTPAADSCTCISVVIVDILKVVMAIVSAGSVATYFRVRIPTTAAGQPHAVSIGGHDVPHLGQSPILVAGSPQSSGVQGEASATPLAAAAPPATAVDPDAADPPQMTRCGIHITIGKGDMPIEDSETLVQALGTITFRDGKHHGSKFHQVMTTDPAYGKWVKAHLNKGLDRIFHLYAAYSELSPRIPAMWSEFAAVH